MSLSRAAAGALVAAAVVLLTAGPARGQAPAPVLEPRGACPADVDIVYDVSSVTGAANTRYRIRRGTVGLENELLEGTSGRLARDLRAYAHPILDGTPYEIQLRAYSATGTEIGNWSAAAQVAGDLTPTGRFTATAGSGNAIELSWDLAADASLAGCADRVRWEVKSGPFASATAADPAATTGVASGTSGSQTITVPGPGSYQVRLLALYGGEAATDAIGRWSDPQSVTLAPATLTLRVRVTDEEAARCSGQEAPREGAEVVLVTAGSTRTRTATTDRDGFATFEVDPSGAYELAARVKGKLGECASDPVRVTAVGRGVELALKGCVSDQGDRAVEFPRETAAIGSVSPPSVTVVVLNRGAGLVAPAGVLVVEAAGPAPGGARGTPRTAPPPTTIGATPSTRTTGAALLREAFGPICLGEELTYSVASSAPLVARIEPPKADAAPENDTARQVLAVVGRPPDAGAPSGTGNVVAPELRFVGVWQPATVESTELRFVGVWRPQAITSSELRFVGVWQPVTITAPELRFIGTGTP